MENETFIKAVCLAVSAQIAALVSHDLKNCLAVIGETSGLLEDLASIYDEDGIPASRVRSGAKVIHAQIYRADTIIRALNRFAHSGDNETESVKLNETIQRMVLLTSRRAASNRIEVCVTCPDEVQVSTHPQVMEALLFQLLCAIYDVSSDGSKLNIGINRQDNHIDITFSSTTRAHANSLCSPGEEERILAMAIAGTLIPGANDMTLSIPVIIQSCQEAASPATLVQDSS